jgi:hypothetical protein
MEWFERVSAMNRSVKYVLVCLMLSVAGVSVCAAQSVKPFVGRWALTIPGGAAGWLGVAEENGQPVAQILWGGGSVVPVDRARMDGDTLRLERDQKVQRKDAAGKVTESQTLTETILAKVSGDTLSLTQIRPNRDGKADGRSEFTGKRIPPLPAKPDLTKAKYGKPIELFNGKNLDGWKLTNPKSTNGWSVKDGVLVNNPVKREGQRGVSYGNLRTEAGDFEDFNLKLEVNVAANENSGVYLRGIYEIQVCGSYGKKLDSHNMGGVYSRITPRVSAEKPAGQWQSLSLTLVDRHVTIELNGKLIIDNEPLLGCTGGALWSDESKPGPIYLQGDHTAISYRNIVLTPIVKR